MAQDIEIPALIVDRLIPEGSDLLIQRTNGNGLWNWRVTHRDGTTGQSTTYTGSDLDEAFSMFNRHGFSKPPA